MLIFAILTGIAFYGISVYTAQANETRVSSDLGTFEVAIKDYMLNNMAACSDGNLTPEGLNHYLTQENLLTSDTADDDIGSEVSVSAGVNGEANYKKLSTLEDPWGHQYRVVIRNNADRQAGDSDLGAKGTDRAFIYAYSMGKDGKGAADDTKQDDSVLVVQYSDGEVFSKVYLPSDSKNQAVAVPAYTVWNKDNSGKHSVMSEAIFAVGAVDPSATPGGGGSSGGGGSGGGTSNPDATAAGSATFSDGVTLSWEDLKAGVDADKYEYHADAITNTSIGDSAFYGCRDLSSVNIPDGVTSIGSYAFRGCPNLKGINISDRVSSIGTGAFESCGLTHVTIPGRATLSDGAFGYCSNLETVVIENGVVSIGDFTFRNCGLTSITIPSSVTSIGRGAFKGCAALTEIVVPDNVALIGQQAFDGCALMSITIPSSVTSIGDMAFRNCPLLTLVTYNGTKEQWNAISKTENDSDAWDYGTGSFTIRCTDGDISKS